MSVNNSPCPGITTRASSVAIKSNVARVAGTAAASTARGKITSEELPHALRHVASDGLAAVFARAPGLWGDALECFASPPLARVLAVSIEDIPPQHRVRVLRLVAATLGEEAIPVMLARVPRAAVGEQLEMLFLAVAFELFDAAENVWHNWGAYCALSSPWRKTTEISRQFCNFLVNGRISGSY